MSNEFHRLSSLDKESRTAICSICGPVKVKTRKRIGTGEFRCINREREVKRAWYKTPKGMAYKRRHNSQRSGVYRAYLKQVCERCGFVPERPEQLDGHHIDKNHKNNSKDNIMTLCACCHRLAHIPDYEFSLTNPACDRVSFEVVVATKPVNPDLGLSVMARKPIFKSNGKLV